MDAQAIRMQAEARGLSPHQAEVAAIIIGLVEVTARLIGAIEAHYGLWARLDQIAARAVDNVSASLSGEIDNLGLSLNRKAARRLARIVTGLSAGTPRTLQSIYADHGNLIEMCRTVPARKPAPRPYVPHRPVDITPYWADMDAADLWPAGIVL